MLNRSMRAPGIQHATAAHRSMKYILHAEGRRLPAEPSESATHRSIRGEYSPSQFFTPSGV